MKALSSLLLVLAICVATIIPSSAAADKELTNVHGDVTYQLGTAAAQPVAPNVSVALANSALAKTGPNSQAKITLPDSSVVTIGQSTSIQLAAFDQQPGITTANFVIVNGKMRFAVSHPSGAKANYTFQTSTGQIAVRGTEGDISSDATQLQVNVYSLGDPNLPVEVTLNNGKHYTLGAGQALVVGVTGAVIAAAAVSSVTSPLTSTFSEFGAPSNSAAAAGAAAAGAAAGVAPAAIAAGAAAVVAGAVIAGSTHGGTTVSAPIVPPTPSPGDVVVKPSSITLTKSGNTANFNATQKNGNDSFTAVSDNTNAATVTPSSTKTFTVTAGAGGGTAHITVTGAGGKTAVVTVTAASGTITPSTSSVQITSVGGTAQFSATEPGYTGTLIPTGFNTSIVTVNGSPSGPGTTAFTVTGVASGTTSIGVKDTNGNVMASPVTANVIAGPIKVAPSTLAFMKAFGETQTFTASEPPFAGNFTAQSNNGNVTVTPSSNALFKVTSVANGSATITVKDGLGHSNTVSVTVSSPVPQPSTTCVPIIIHAKHGELHGPGEAATPCPSAPPAAPPPRTAPKPNPVASPVTKPAKPQPQRSPGNPMRPMQPLTGPQGILTPPPLPIPPGGSPP
jgi:hypothetical protein